MGDAGLRLLPCSLPSKTGPVTPLGASSETEPIFDYLATAVFARFTSDEQRRLLYTACLDRFTPEQAETMSGSPRRTLTTLTTWSRPSPLSLPLGRDDRNVQATRRNGNRWISLRPETSRNDLSLHISLSQAGCRGFESRVPLEEDKQKRPVRKTPSRFFR
jgi:hypothetical protein